MARNQQQMKLLPPPSRNTDARNTAVPITLLSPAVSFQYVRQDQQQQRDTVLRLHGN